MKYKVGELVRRISSAWPPMEQTVGIICVAGLTHSTVLVNGSLHSINNDMLRVVDIERMQLVEVGELTRSLRRLNTSVD